jgi:hypothetical protein
MPEQNKRDFWLYVGLVISGLLNLTGLASIVDGLVTWAHFFRDIIDVYRTVIREPRQDFRGSGEALVRRHQWRALAPRQREVEAIVGRMIDRDRNS